jgi:hypothetical protein
VEESSWQLYWADTDVTPIQFKNTEFNRTSGKGPAPEIRDCENRSGEGALLAPHLRIRNLCVGRLHTVRIWFTDPTIF